MQIDPQGALPRYQQLKAILRRQIEAGVWHANEPIPAERSLVEQYKVSRITVRQALDDLVAEGFLYRAHGKGTFVAERTIIHSLAELTGLVEDLRWHGFDPAVQVLTRQVQPAPPEVTRVLELREGSPALYIQRLVRVGGEPLFYDQSWLPEVLAPVVSDVAVAENIYPNLEAAGHIISKGEQRIEAVALGQQEATLLGGPPGAPALRVARITYRVDGLPLEYTLATYRADRYQYSVELRRSRVLAQPR